MHYSEAAKFRITKPASAVLLHEIEKKKKNLKEHKNKSQLQEYIFSHH